MTELTGDLRGAQLTEADLTGARLHRVRLNDARLRMVDLSGAVLRDVDLSGVSIDGAYTDGLVVNGVAIGPLIEVELTRRQPARALLSSDDPDDLRAAWVSIEAGWATTYDRVAALPEGIVHETVEDEWSLAQTLRHLVFATDAWLGAIRGELQFHPWGMPFSEVAEFVDGAPASLGVDPSASPGWHDVLELRADRVAQVRDYLATATRADLAATCGGPPWEEERQLTALRCLRVILTEELEHHRFAERDLDALATRSHAAPAPDPSDPSDPD